MSVNRNPKIGLWDVQVWYRTYEGARREKHRRGFKTKSAGRDWERQFLLRANGSPSMSFADFVGLYIGGCQTASQAQYVLDESAHLGHQAGAGLRRDEAERNHDLSDCRE